MFTERINYTEDRQVNWIGMHSLFSSFIFQDEIWDVGLAETDVFFIGYRCHVFSEPRKSGAQPLFVHIAFDCASGIA